MEADKNWRSTEREKLKNKPYDKLNCSCTEPAWTQQDQYWASLCAMTFVILTDCEKMRHSVTYFLPMHHSSNSDVLDIC